MEKVLLFPALKRNSQSFKREIKKPLRLFLQKGMEREFQKLCVQSGENSFLMG